MGLDICLKRMGKVDHTKTYTEEEFKKQYGSAPRVLWECEKGEPWKEIKGLSKDYICKVSVGFSDDKKMLASKGKDVSDGWKWAMTSYGFSEDERKEFGIPEDMNEGDVIGVVKYSRRNAKGKEIESVYVVVTHDNIKSFSTYVECWCCLVAEDEIGYMRKGANEQFYKDGMWDADKIVCSKEVLKEHMEKYFDEKDEMYGNARAYFKANIYDKFKDGEGMYVIYC